MVLLGAAGQVGIFGTLMLATCWASRSTRPPPSASSAPSTARLDLRRHQAGARLLAPIAVAAYSYMSLIPIIQPPLMRLLTTRAERRIRMAYAPGRSPAAPWWLFPSSSPWRPDCWSPPRHPDRHADAREPAARESGWSIG